MIVETALGPVSLERSGHGPDLVLLHSLLTDSHAFDPVLPALEARWRVNLIDLPGFGDTTRVAENMDAYADLIGAFLDATGYGPDTALMGNGLGSFVALGTGIRHPARVGRLVLVGSGSGFADDAKPAFATMASRALEMGMEGVVEIALLRIFTAEWMETHPAEVEERRQVLLGTNPEALAAACGALQRFDYSEGAASLDIPTLIVVGTDDAATPPAMAHDLAALLPRGELIVMDGVAHGPQLQEPDRFVEAIARFLDLN